MLVLLEQVRGQKGHGFAQRHGNPGLGLALSLAQRCTGLTLRALGEAVELKCYAEKTTITT